MPKATADTQAKPNGVLPWFPSRQERRTVRLEVPGLPIAQPRQRHTKTGINYTPTNAPANRWKATLALAWQEQGQQPLTGALMLWCEFVLPRTKTCPAKVPRPLWKAAQWILHRSRPDLDNLVKAVKDALNGLAWADDCQVAQLFAGKRYAADGEAPHAKLTIQEVQP